MRLRAQFATSLSSALCALLVTGCASPGVPHAPSLYLPAPVHNLTADRVGPAVVLHFTAPRRTTDNIPLRAASLGLRVCRELAPATACTPVPQLPNSFSTRTAQGAANTVTLTDTLPTTLASGPARLIAYRVELLNDKGRSGGLSDPAYTLGGQAPARVEALAATGSRLGTVLNWAAAPVDDDTKLFLRRELVSTATPAHEPLLLRAPEAAQQNRTLDTAAEDAQTYRYTAYRERRVTLGGRTLPERSETSAPVTFTLRDTFPPPTPGDLTAAPFTTDGKFSIDLIWQPVEDPGLTGYLVYREDLTARSARVKLTPAPLPTPAFHDVTAAAGVRYRYSVTSIDTKGNESIATTATVEPGN